MLPTITWETPAGDHTGPATATHRVVVTIPHVAAFTPSRLDGSRRLYNKVVMVAESNSKRTLQRRLRDQNFLLK